MKGRKNTPEEWNRILKAVQDELRTGKNVKQALQHLGIHPATYYRARKTLKIKTRTPRITVTELPQPAITHKVFTFYGDPQAVAEIVRSLQ